MPHPGLCHLCHLATQPHWSTSQRRVYQWTLTLGELREEIQTASIFQTYKVNSVKLQPHFDHMEPAADNANVRRDFWVVIAPYTRSITGVAGTALPTIQDLVNCTWRAFTIASKDGTSGITGDARALQATTFSVANPTYTDFIAGENQSRSVGGQRMSNQHLNLINDNGLDDTEWKLFVLSLSVPGALRLSTDTFTFKFAYMQGISITFEGNR